VVSAPQVSVQIAAAAAGYETHSAPGAARAVAEALARAGWLHDPAEVAALRARLDESDRLVLRLEAERDEALDALPPAAGDR
jgi:hypothetical protein